MKILSLAPLAGPGLKILESLGEVTVDPWIDQVPIKLHAAHELIPRLEGVEILIVEADFLSAEVLDGSSLRFLGVCRGDPNNVDVAAATRNGIVVIRTPGRNAVAVAELTIGFMYSLLRSIVAADDDIRAGRWVVDGRIPQQRYKGHELAGSTVGLVGLGAVARVVAKILQATGSRVLAYDPFVPAEDVRALGIEPIADLGDLMEASDIISVHAPLNAATRGMIGEAEFARVRPGSYYVNTARYGIAQEEPLLAALRDGRFAGAALDHFEHEYLAPDHPLVSMPNVVLTPHIGGATIETIQNHTSQIAEGIRDVLAGGMPDSVVNPEAAQQA
ncbi:MAG: NAD(P)-dependent oxidoreductase [Actinomycetota bacterium]